MYVKLGAHELLFLSGIGSGAWWLDGHAFGGSHTWYGLGAYAVGRISQWIYEEIKS